MKIKNLTLILSILFFCQCSSATITEKNEKCKQIGVRANKLILHYLFFHDTTYARLDTALYLIDSISGDCPVYYAGLTTSKLKILCLEKRYSETIDYTKTLEDIKLRPLLKKSILLNRFYAMQSRYKGDTLSSNKYIKKIITELKDSLSGYSSKLDSVLQRPKVVDIFTYRKTFTLMQYYYYRAQIEGVDKISEELDIYQKRINGNKDCFKNLKEPLKNNFMEFYGI